MVDKLQFGYLVQRSRNLFASCISQHHSFTKTINVIQSAQETFEKFLKQGPCPKIGVIEGLQELDRLLTAFGAAVPPARDDETLSKEWDQILVVVETLADISSS